MDIAFRMKYLFILFFIGIQLLGAQSPPKPKKLDETKMTEAELNKYFDKKEKHKKKLDKDVTKKPDKPTTKKPEKKFTTTQNPYKKEDPKYQPQSKKKQEENK